MSQKIETGRWYIYDNKGRTRQAEVVREKRSLLKAKKSDKKRR